MPNNDAFSGIRLSEQVGQASVEQRLFAVSQPSPTPKEPKLVNQETGKPRSREVEKTRGKDVSQEGVREASKERRVRLDLADIPTHKDSFLFTPAEFEALEDLKIEFRRKHDLKITKNDLARCALHLLVEDYETNQERSFLGRKFLGKPNKR
jgi:hypothetical protein